MLELKSFECKSCSYLIYVPEKQEEPSWCPVCRGKMFFLEEGEVRKLEELKCPECEYVFYIQKEAPSPYKCPNCNFTFVVTPGGRVIHRL